MTDVVNPQVRSRMMASIRGKDTKPELALRKALHGLGLRYRLHARDLPGKPDLVFPRFKTVVFVHGCFWHRHPDCRYASTPATRPEFWSAKFAGNVARDQRVSTSLQANGWLVLTVWECDIKKRGGIVIAQEVERFLRDDGKAHCYFLSA